MLPDALVHEVSEALQETGFEREVVLAQLERSVRAALPDAKSDREQFLSDLVHLGRMGRTLDGKFPLRILLENARRLAGLRACATVFARALAHLPGDESADRPTMQAQIPAETSHGITASTTEKHSRDLFDFACARLRQEFADAANLQFVELMHVIKMPPELQPAQDRTTGDKIAAILPWAAAEFRRNTRFADSFSAAIEQVLAARRRP